jgi:hypothetical protein
VERVERTHGLARPVEPVASDSEEGPPLGRATQLGASSSRLGFRQVAEYARRADRLSEAERLHLLDVLEGLRVSRRGRSARAVDQEIADIRDARRRGGRRS